MNPGSRLTHLRSSVSAAEDHDSSACRGRKRAPFEQGREAGAGRYSKLGITRTGPAAAMSRQCGGQPRRVLLRKLAAVALPGMLRTRPWHRRRHSGGSTRRGRCLMRPRTGAARSCAPRRALPSMRFGLLCAQLARADISPLDGNSGYDLGRAKTYFSPKNCTQPVAVQVDTTL